MSASILPPTPPASMRLLSQIPHFDARTMPALPEADMLPPVARERLAPDRLRARFAAPPEWEPELHGDRNATGRPPAPAAVLVGIVARDEPTVLLTQRTTQLSNHSGQIAFPGGRIDPGDRDAEDAALREATEEVGLARQFAEVIGALPQHGTGTGFVITPVVALLQPGFTLTLNPHEVAAAFEVPLAFLMDPANHRRHVYRWPDGERRWFSMPYQDGTSERFVWGATAAMLRNLYRFLAA